jgi:hypothetical protein
LVRARAIELFVVPKSIPSAGPPEYVEGMLF